MHRVPRHLPRPGELERLIDAETAFHASPVPTGARPPAPAEYDRGRERSEQRDHERRGYEPPGYDSRYDQHGYGHRKKRKSFFEELFD
jgi:Zn-finger nucleic acid-binding protein